VFEGIRCYEAATALGDLPARGARRSAVRSAHVLDMPMPFTREAIAQACIETVRANGCGVLHPSDRVHGRRRDGLAARPRPASRSRRGRGAYLGDEGMQNGRAREDELVRALPSEHADDEGEGGRALRQLDPRGARSARRSATTRRCCSTSTATSSEASGENIFIVRDGVVKTTPLPTVLGGITRRRVLTLLADLDPTREERFTRDEVYLADEAFFTGTAAR
jgi:branched-chain amino acid aminotransferase